MDEGIKIIETYEPVAAMVAYKGSDESFYLETYPIKNGLMLTGKPASAKIIEEIADSYAKKFSEQIIGFDGIIPSNVIWAKSKNRNCEIIWWEPKKKVKMTFKKEMKIPSGEAWIPELLWSYKNGDVNLFALNKPFDRNDKKVLLHHAPFFNVYNVGNICWGNVDLKDQYNSFEEIMEHVPEQFFGSKFSEHLHSDCGDIHNHWRSAINTGLNQFKLMPMNIKVLDYIERFMGQ